MENETYRTVADTVPGVRGVDGAGVKLVRVLGHETAERFDPFLMLDAFDSADPSDYVKGFPWHPHRGIETVTFLINGRIDHGDSLGNSGSILDGGCQWMTAGSGIIHQEMPKPAERMLGLQLWINMPGKQKMDQPAYHDITTDMVPVVSEEGAEVRIVGGSFRGVKGAFQGRFVDAALLDIALEPGASLVVPVRSEDTVFAYSMEGRLSFAAREADEPSFVDSRKAVRLEKGNAVRISAEPAAKARLVLFAARPLREPIAWGGPIVMNTREELDQAFRELDEGTFIKKRKD